jgi:hypothetical protein
MGMIATPTQKAQPSTAPPPAPARRQAPPSAFHSPAPGPQWNIEALPVRPKLTIGAVDDQEVRSPNKANSGTDEPGLAHRQATEIPAADLQDSDPIDQPSAAAGTPAPSPVASGAVTPVPADDCGQPRSMGNTISGGFLGGVTLDDYYPDLTGRGFWQHPGTGGTFDTGARVGGVVQLFGVIPSPCDPSRYTLAQSVTYTRKRMDGATDPNEGRTFDDIRKSGRNAAAAPFRQDFLGGGAAPLGYLISMADPPSMGYGPTTNAEFDRDFVTSLVGPAGQQSVNWSLSIRIANGVVTRNSLS